MTRFIRLFLMVLALAFLPLQSMAAQSAAPCPEVEMVKSAPHATMAMEQHQAGPAKSTPVSGDWCKGGTACGLMAVALPASDVTVMPVDKASGFRPVSHSLCLQEFPYSLLRPPRFLA